MKYEWRKKEKDIYLPKNKPEVIEVPTLQFLTIAGEGNPNSEAFSEYIGALYAVSYAIKMTLKKGHHPRVIQITPFTPWKEYGMSMKRQKRILPVPSTKMI